MQQKHWWLYVLKLEQAKYYIGITSQTPEKRFQEHLGGRKTYWTEKYKPLEIFDKQFLADLPEDAVKLYEKRVTRKYMRKYGVNNVRGGDLTKVNDYVVRFRRIFDKDDWENIVVMSVMLVVIAYLLIDKFL